MHQIHCDTRPSSSSYWRYRRGPLQDEAIQAKSLRVRPYGTDVESVWNVVVSLPLCIFTFMHTGIPHIADKITSALFWYETN